MCPPQTRGGIHDRSTAGQQAPTDMTNQVRAMVSPEQWGDVDPISRTMLEDEGIELIRNTRRRLLVEHEVIELIEGCDVAISGAEPMTRAVIEAAPNLRFISKASVGLDSTDLLFARERGIPVSYVGGANAQAVTELTVSHILTLIRGVQRADATLRRGEWFRVMGRSMEELTIGIIGVGRIGGRVARLLSIMGARIIANDIAPNEELGAEIGIEWVEKEELFERADVICLHVPKAPSTLGLISRSAIALMKDGAIVINTARGGLIDEPALAEALRRGKIAGAGLDCFSEEPYRGDLAGLDNVIMTCHMGANTRSSRARMELWAAENLLCFLRGDPIPGLVPESEYELQAAMAELKQLGSQPG
jgi:D-3-phosphoglycerate dehydrogenase